jgi:hypothetical protein
MAAGTVIVGMFGTFLSVLKWTWWLILIIWMFWTKKKYERWPIDAVVIEKRGENLIKTNDRIGRDLERDTGLVCWKLKSNGDKMPVYNFNWILHNADKPTNMFEKIVSFMRPNTGTVFLFRYGSKQYKPISITKKGEDSEHLKLSEFKDKEGQPIFKYDYGVWDPRWVLGVLDFEVIDWDNMNFMVQEQRASAVRRAKKGDFWKNFGISAMILGVTALVALLILKFSSDAGAQLRSAGTSAPQPEKGGSVIGGAISGAITPAG